MVDYAHTPDALSNVIATIYEIKKNSTTRLIVVFGCGGDRDRGKRPEMGKIAAKESEWVVLTSDNPRSEDPQSIISDIVAGIPQQERWKVLEEPDRRNAITVAMMLARGGDWVLVAGKGHETYQEALGQRCHFDDREEVCAVLKRLRGEGK